MKPHSLLTPQVRYTGKSVVNRINGERAFETFHFVDGVSGAICVRMGQYKVYFHNGTIVGVSVGATMYFHNPDRRNPSARFRTARRGPGSCAPRAPVNRSGDRTARTARRPAAALGPARARRPAVAPAAARPVAQQPAQAVATRPAGAEAGPVVAPDSVS